jgi:hypothetical protein
MPTCLSLACLCLKVDRVQNKSLHIKSVESIQMMMMDYLFAFCLVDHILGNNGILLYKYGILTLKKSEIIPVCHKAELLVGHLITFLFQ